MKCRACWTEKAYVRPTQGWREVALTWLGLVPLKCHHCYHRFWLPRPLTVGKQLVPPALQSRRARAIRWLWPFRNPPATSARLAAAEPAHR